LVAEFVVEKNRPNTVHFTIFAQLAVVDVLEVLSVNELKFFILSLIQLCHVLRLDRRSLILGLSEMEVHLFDRISYFWDQVVFLNQEFLLLLDLPQLLHSFAIEQEIKITNFILLSLLVYCKLYDI